MLNNIGQLFTGLDFITVFWEHFLMFSVACFSKRENREQIMHLRHNITVIQISYDRKVIFFDVGEQLDDS